MPLETKKCISEYINILKRRRKATIVNNFTSLLIKKKKRKQCKLKVTQTTGSNRTINRILIKTIEKMTSCKLSAVTVCKWTVNPSYGKKIELSKRMTICKQALSK